MLKNVLIVVDDIEKSIEFYRDLFGLQVILKNEGNVILSEGLVLQDVDIWGKTLNETSTPFNNMMELYFEDFDIDPIVRLQEQRTLSTQADFPVKPDSRFLRWPCIPRVPYHPS